MQHVTLASTHFSPVLYFIVKLAIWFISQIWNATLSWNGLNGSRKEKSETLNSLMPRGKKLSYVIKKTCSFWLQVCLSRYVFQVPMKYLQIVIDISKTSLKTYLNKLTAKSYELLLLQDTKGLSFYFQIGSLSEVFKITHLLKASSSIWVCADINPLTANPTKLSKTLKQFAVWFWGKIAQH